MSLNATNATIIGTTTVNSISWSALIFLICVAVLFILAIVLILYFKACCCFSKYRCLKPILKWIGQTNTLQSASSKDATHSFSETSLNKSDSTAKHSQHKHPEYLWFAGQCEHIDLFKPTTCFETIKFGSDLPDDDYTTLVPPIKRANSASRKLPDIPTISEPKDNDSSLKKVKTSNSKPNDQTKTTITRVTRRYPSNDRDSIGCVQSAPSSPALLRHIGAKPNLNISLSDQVNADVKSTSSEKGPTLTNASSNNFSSGTLELRLKFDAKNSKMWVFVIKATLDMDQNALKNTLVQIHLTMLPNKRIRYRTQAKPAENAMFAEEFLCKVLPESIQTQGIRFRLYINKRFKREKLIGEATVMFGLINLDEDMCKIIPLEPVYSSDDSELASSNSRTGSIAIPTKELSSNVRYDNSILPELEIGLAYDRKQSILILEIGKGINFCMSSQGRAPDTYAQLTLLNSSGDPMASNRTMTRRNQHHPVFAERYPFNIEESLLNQITIVITVVNKKSSGKNDRNIGWISFGHGISGNVQSAHWESMLNAQGETVTRWHTLLES